ncbi:MAG: WG repeat-containing protein [Bacilli bacterium]|nr:WG repeat-containing protein [Bacilli bacterium]MBN2876794.1 WG repeat-containing protein [Bacilli bacterium]
MKKYMMTVLMILVSLLLVSCTKGTNGNSYGDDLFHQGLLPVTEDGVLWGYANTKGEIVIEQLYIGATNFYDCGVAVVYDEGRVAHIIDTEGNIIPTEGVKSIHEFNSSGYAPFLSSDLQMGILDCEGNIVLDATYKMIFPSFLNIFIFIEDSPRELQGLIDIEGNVILDATYNYIKPFSGISNLTQVTGEDNMEGAINSDGEVVVEPIYENILIDYYHNFVLARDMDGMWGLFDSDGTAIVDMDSIIPVVFDETNKDGEKLATMIDEDHNITMIDEDGEVVSTFMAPEGAIFGNYYPLYIPMYNYGVNGFRSTDSYSLGIYDIYGNQLTDENDVGWYNDLLYTKYDLDNHQLVFYTYDQEVVLEIEDHISVDLDTGYPDYFTIYTIDENKLYSIHIFDYDGNPIYEGSKLSYNEMYLPVNQNGYTLINEEVNGEYLFGFLDSDFNEVIEPTFALDQEYVGRWGFYPDGYAVLSIDEKYGVIDGKGNVILDFIYEDMNRIGFSKVEDNWLYRLYTIY